MKLGRNLQDLATELERQQNAKRDFVASTAAFTMTADGADLDLAQAGAYNINGLTHNQLASYTDIPMKYYDLMRDKAPALLADNVNTWLGQKNEPRMIRTLDGTARAFLSDRYRPLENYDLAEAALPVLMELNLQIVSCEVTERRLYIKAVDPKIERDIPKGAKMGDGSHHIFDTLCPALTLSNSEVGLGSLSVEVGTLTKACTNLAFFSQRGMRKYHVGGKHAITEGEDFMRLMSNETRAATDKAVWMQVRDVVKNAFDEARFDSLIQDIKETALQPITGDVPKVIEVVANRFQMNSTQRGSVLKHLIEGADLSRYGLSNAITRAAEDLPNYDDATNFERLGGQIIELSKSEWKALSSIGA